MQRGTTVKLVNGNDTGCVILSPSNVDGMTMYMVLWNTMRYTWEREEDLIVCM